MSDGLSYAKVGVDIDVTDAAKRGMASSIDRGDRRVLNRVGAFASLVDGRFEGYEHPVLVLKTDEPGSKQKLAFELGRVSAIAYDLVNHLLNDVVVMGAEPLYMQDCIVCGAIDAEVVKELVDGLAEACREQGCVLTGGETSVQPGVVTEGVYVLSASAIGVVDRDKIIDGSRIAAGDIVIAVASNGLHTNGYTLVRKLMEDNPALKDRDLDGETFLDVIMRPHMAFYPAIRGLFELEGIKGFAHITGGGIGDNLKRILPPELDAIVELASVRVPEVFGIIRSEGKVQDAEMLRTFNVGVGMAVVSSPEIATQVIEQVEQTGDFECYPCGEIVSGSGEVVLRGQLNW